MESPHLPRISRSYSDSNLPKTKKNQGTLRTTTDLRRVALENQFLQRKYVQHSLRDTLKLPKTLPKELQERENINLGDTVKLTPELIRQMLQEGENKKAEHPQDEPEINKGPEQPEANHPTLAHHNPEEKKNKADPLEPAAPPKSSANRKEQSRFRKFIIQNFNNPDKRARKAYKNAIKEELKNFDKLSPQRQRELKAFQEYYDIKPKKTKTSRVQQGTKRFKGIVDYFKQLSTIAKNVATIAQRLTPASLSASVQTGVQAGASVGAAGVEAAGVGLGVFLMPVQIIRTKEKHDYANIYIKNKESSGTQKLSNKEKELLAAAHYLKNQHRYWDKRLNALDSVQSLVSTGLSTTCALVAAVAAPLLPIIVPIAGGVGLGIVTGSLSTSVGVITFKKAKSAFKWVQAKKAKQAYESPEGLAARSARRQALKDYRAENGLDSKTYKLKNLSPAAKILLREEIRVRSQEITKQRYMERSGKFASQEICKTLREEQMAYYKDKSPNATLADSPTLDFLKHFNIKEDTIKAVVDCEDYAIAAKLLRQEMKGGISNLKQTDIQEALENARSKRQEARQVAKEERQKAKEEAKVQAKAAKEAAKVTKA
jgi:hypothetical protein